MHYRYLSSYLFSLLAHALYFKTSLLAFKHDILPLSLMFVRGSGRYSCCLIRPFVVIFHLLHGSVLCHGSRWRLFYFVPLKFSFLFSISLIFSISGIFSRPSQGHLTVLVSYSFFFLDVQFTIRVLYHFVWFIAYSHFSLFFSLFLHPSMLFAISAASPSPGGLAFGAYDRSTQFLATPFRFF